MASRDGQAAASIQERSWQQVYRGDEAQIRELRRWLTELLPECAARDDVITVAAELATNAVKHTATGRDGSFGVEVSWRDSAVRVVIADQGAPGGPRLIDDPMGEHGRGLHVVRGLSARTGVAGDWRGRLVWAEVPWPAGTPSSAGSPQAAGSPDGCAPVPVDGSYALQ